MVKYIIRRFIYIIFVFFLISVMMFAIYKAVPSDPVRMQLQGREQEMRPEQFERLMEQTRRQLGLDKPVYIQYFRWMGNMLRLDFGRSATHRRPVIEVIKAPMANTIMLNVITMVIVFIIVIPLGIRTAVKKGSVFDSSVQVVTILGYSLPTYIICLFSIFLFASTLQWFPVGGSVTPGLDLTGTKADIFFDRVWHIVLPIGVMVFTSLGSLTRYIRATMIDALRMDYIRTARAKGLREKVVVYSHAFRNSMIPFVTAMIGWLISLFSGSLMVETIFSWQGMGRLFYDALVGSDYSVVLALGMFYVLLGLVGNLIIDIAYTVVDPRVRLA
ncbi:MAG: ABC transporter permease [Oscillospiraceae bacterium]|jgi:peptide/nickel transport system permease protein|nr:ABC transporter permease [Oscillospiraceae bacterium]